MFSVYKEMTAISLLLAEKDVESGGKSIENDFAYRNNVAQASVQIRLGKLYILFVYTVLHLCDGVSVVFSALVWLFDTECDSSLQSMKTRKETITPL